MARVRTMGTAVVIGAGVSGLTTAWELQERGWRAKIYTDRAPEQSTSFLAAAVWYPTRVGPRASVFQWGLATYEAFSQLALHGVPGVIMRQSLVLHREKSEPPWWADAVGGVRPARSDELPPGYPHGLRFIVPLAVMPIYLPWLAAQVKTRGALIMYRQINEFDDVSHEGEVVINCTGLGARLLAKDTCLGGWCLSRSPRNVSSQLRPCWPLPPERGCPKVF